MPGQHVGKARRIEGQRPPLVPKKCKRLAQGFAAVGQSNNAQRVPVRPQGRRDHRDAVCAFGHGEQCVRPPAFEFDVRCKLRKAAGGIKVSAECETAIEEQQREWGEPGNLNGFARAGQE